MTHALRAPPLNLLLGAGPPLPSRRVKVNEVFSKERLNAGRLGLLPQGASLSAVETQQVASALGYIYRGCVQFSADEASFAAALASTTEASEACGSATGGVGSIQGCRSGRRSARLETWRARGNGVAAWHGALFVELLFLDGTIRPTDISGAD